MDGSTPRGLTPLACLKPLDELIPHSPNGSLKKQNCTTARVR
ncbi:hypothetical protein DCCM_0643 [Desulfocucumis palustris]|uniref:Uncharacterized protein n=1 Tax=Desulfocucumis palustris TaxID=1898651 RepID=A0A2L2X8A7_9FIRM|nr:hypothetical protein DCCM_0643 [Desulfocucumis palustris]